MALCSLISLAFREKRLAGPPWRVAENLNYPNYLRGPDGQALSLAVQLLQIPNHPKAKMDGANVIADCDNVGMRTAEGRFLVPGVGNAAIPAQGRPGKAKRQPLRASEAPAIAGLCGSHIHRAMA